MAANSDRAPMLEDEYEAFQQQSSQNQNNLTKSEKVEGDCCKNLWDKSFGCCIRSEKAFK